MTETSPAVAEEQPQDAESQAPDEQPAPMGEGPTGEDAPEPEPEEDEPEEDGRLGAGAELDDEELLRRLAALLFASPEPLSMDRLVKLLERPGRPRVKAALETLGTRLSAAGLPMEVRGLRGGYTLMTSADVGVVVGRLAKGQGAERISAAALETLSIVAYRQPVTKAEIEAIRGVQAGPVLRSLVDRGLIKVTGRAEVPGNPLEYGTTPEFLDRFGLMSLEELPRDAELARG